MNFTNINLSKRIHAIRFQSHKVKTKLNHTKTERKIKEFLLWLSELRIQHCQKLQQSSQMRLRSGVEVVMAQVSAAVPITPLSWKLPYVTSVALSWQRWGTKPHCKKLGLWLTQGEESVSDSENGYKGSFQRAGEYFISLDGQDSSCICFVII